MKTSPKKTLLVALVVPAIALTAACTSGGNNKSASADSAGSKAAPATAPKPAVDGPALQPQKGELDSLSGDFAATGTSGARNAPDLSPAAGESQDNAETPPQTQAIISKGQISLRSKDIDQVRFDLQKLLDGLDGTIADEQSAANKEGRTIRQRLVLRIPSAKFSQAMDRISRLPGATLVSRSRSSEDVTTQVIDVNTRVATQRASLARIQALMSRASTLQEIISLESQLSRRQAQLDSLEAQQKYLADQTSLSTINVYLTAPKKKPAAHHHDDHNFFSGLNAGWDHLGSSTNAVLIGIGAVLPFGVVLALIGFPAWAAWRRRTARAEPAEA